MTNKPILTFTPLVRKKLIVIFMATLIGLQGIYVVFPVIFPVPEIWPFSPYEMFSRAKPKKYATTLEIKGVIAEGGEFSLNVSKYFYPFDPVRLRSGIRSVLRNNDPLKRQRNLDELFSYLLDQYAITKKSGYHKGPPIVALRLYRKTWDWSQEPPEKVVPATILLYSTAIGQSQGEE